jgi:hypothetical protein
VVFTIFYSCAEFKSLLDPGPRRLEDLEEVRDILLAVRDAGGQCIARFGCGDVVFPGDLMAQLSELVGHETGILRVDGRYHVRDLDSEAKQRAEAESCSMMRGADPRQSLVQKVKEGC